jgi:hypothetical protein
VPGFHRTSLSNTLHRLLPKHHEHISVRGPNATFENGEHNGK